MRKSNLNLVRGRHIALVFAFAVSMIGLRGQQSLESNFRMGGEAITQIFEPQRQAIQKFSAVLYDGRDEIAYGVVISEDGYILTKASEVQDIGELNVRVDRVSFKQAEIISVDPVWDVALVKVDAEGLVPADYAETSESELGDWVIVNGATSRSRRRILVGVISANPREIPAAGGVALGVQLRETDGGMEVEEVSEGSGAEKGGVKAGDLITAIDGKDVGSIKEIAKALEGMSAGSKVRVSAKRGDESVELDVTLSARGQLFQQVTRNDMMSGDFSSRRSGFPKIIQHDILANSDTMGGPVLNFEGRVIGMNIARANRAETFAIPVEELRSLAETMIGQAEK